MSVLGNSLHDICTPRRHLVLHHLSLVSPEDTEAEKLTLSLGLASASADGNSSSCLTWIQKGSDLVIDFAAGKVFRLSKTEFLLGNDNNDYVGSG